MAGAGGCGIGGIVVMGLRGRGTEEVGDWEERCVWGRNFDGPRAEWVRRRSEWLRRTEDEDDMGGEVEEYDLWGRDTNDRPSGRRMGEKEMEEHDNCLKDEWDSEDLDDDWSSERGGAVRKRTSTPCCWGAPGW